MKIATQLRLLAPSIVLVTAVLVGIVIVWAYITLVDEERLRGLASRADADAGRVSLALQQIQDDIRFLADLPKIAELIDASRRNVPVARALAERQTGDIFVSLLRNRSHYVQVRLIGAEGEGRELIRADRSGGVITRITDDKLQSKGHRDYVHDTLKLPRDGIYVSDITLNREHNVIEVPHRPVLRIAAPLYDNSGETFGLVIINLNFMSLVRTLLEIDDSDFDYFIANVNGDYLLHPDSEKEFGFEFGLQSALQLEYPETSGLIAPGDIDSISTSFVTSIGNARSLMYARRLYPFYDDPSRFLVMALAAPSDTIAAPSQLVVTRVLLTAAVLLVIASVLAFVFASRLTRPLKLLTKSAEQVTHKQDASFPYKDRNDEFGTLSRALEHMIISLRENESSLRESISDLEFFSKIVSHDLTEPARRVAALANLVQMEDAERLSVDSRDSLGRMRAESLKMIHQLTDMRAFARLGSSDTLRKETDIKACIEQVLAAHADEIDRRKIVVRIDSMPIVSVYRNLIEMLFQNLVANALQHARDESFELTFACTQRDGQSVFSVMNTGSDSSLDANQLFDAFYTGSTDSNRAGLGLSICRRIVERHSGQIWAEIEADCVAINFTLTGESN